MVIFLDGLILFNDSFDNHLENVNEVLSSCGIKPDPSKKPQCCCKLTYSKKCT